MHCNVAYENLNCHLVMLHFQDCKTHIVKNYVILQSWLEVQRGATPSAPRRAPVVVIWSVAECRNYYGVTCDIGTGKTSKRKGRTMAQKTITHTQGKGSLSHNNRTFHAKNVDSSRTKDNVTFVRIPISQAYEQCFCSAVERYNAKQKRSDRKIKNGYYEYAFGRKPCDTVVVAADKRKSFYEDIIQIGTKDDTGVGSIDVETVKQCLTEYMKGFSKRSPNFFVFNSVIHMDEATPHLHIDYIPIAHCKRGLDTQNGLAMALKEMGFGDGKDAISRWRENERKILSEICKQHGIEIAAPQKSRGTFEVEEYKRYKDNITALEKEKQAAEKQLSELNGKILTAEELKAIEGKKTLGGALKNVTWEQWQSVKLTADQAKSDKARLKKEITRLQQEIQQLQAENKQLSNNNLALRNEINSPLSNTNLKRTEVITDLKNQIRLLRKALNLSTEAIGDYGKLRNELIERGYIQPNSQKRNR